MPGLLFAVVVGGLQIVKSVPVVLQGQVGLAGLFRASGVFEVDVELDAVGGVANFFLQYADLLTVLGMVLVFFKLDQKG